MTREEFCTRLRRSIPRASDNEWRAIRDELMDHAQDHTLALEEQGHAPEEAEERAFNALGEPEEIGRALNRQLSIFWQMVRWAAILVIVLLCWKILSMGYLYGWLHYKENHMARHEPVNWLSGGVENKVSTYDQGQWVDLRTQIPGNDEMYVYWVGMDAQKGLAGVDVSLYDQNPLGWVGSNPADWLRLYNQRGQSVPAGDSFRDAASGYCRFVGLPVEPTDTHVTLCYERYGKRVELEVPLPWEVSP